MHLFVCLFTHKWEALRPRDEEKLPGSHPVWTCHIQGREETALLMDAESSPWGCLPLFLSLSVLEAGKRQGVPSKNRAPWGGGGGGCSRKDGHSGSACSKRPNRIRNQELGSAGDFAVRSANDFS